MRKRKPNWDSPEDLELWKYCEWIAFLDQEKAMQYFQSGVIPIKDVIRYMEGMDKEMLKHFDVLHSQREKADQKAQPFEEARYKAKNTHQKREFMQAFSEEVIKANTDFAKWCLTRTAKKDELKRNLVKRGGKSKVKDNLENHNGISQVTSQRYITTFLKKYPG